MKTTAFKSVRFTLALAAGVAALAYAPEARAEAPEGFLQVATATQVYDDDGARYYLHTPYTVYRTDGSVAAQVDNHNGNYDEQVETVTLPTGTYQVKAEGLPRFAVTVSHGHTTKIDVENK